MSDSDLKRAARGEPSRNLHHLRERYEPYVGKRVIVGLTTFHYLSGSWKAIEGTQAVFTIGGREHRVALHEIATVAEAEPHVAEYFK